MLKVSRFLEDQEIIQSNNSISTPEISVIMPTYCRGEVSLRRAIESVLNQTFKNFEFIIVDDGSKDGSFEILKEYQEKDSRIIIIRHTLNSGLPALRVNEGIMLSKGKYISYQFDDDEYLPHCLETLYTEIEKHDTPSLVYGSCDIHRKLPDGNITHNILGRPFNYGLLMNGNYIANNSVLHHKSVFELCGLYDPNVIIRRFSDYDLWLRMGRRIKLTWIDKVVTNVYAGEKNSLGVEIDYKMGYIRRYLEIPREDKLLPVCIEHYLVDEVPDAYEYLKPSDIDYLNRFEFIPFRSKVPYCYNDYEIYTENISRPRLRTLAVTKSDFSTSIDVTIRNYTNRIHRFPYTHFFINEAALASIDIEDYDVLALYRTIGKSTTDILKINRMENKPTLYMIDDNMFKFHELGSEFSYLSPSSIGYKNLEEQVSNSDMVISYNPIISEDCKKYNDKVIELKTNIPGKYLNKTVVNDDRNITKIAMFSGQVRTNELRDLWPTLVQISKEYQDKIEFHFWGLNPDDFGTLYCPVVYKPFTHSYDKYLDALHSSDFHYHICPLKGHSDAALSKSPVKLLEGTIAQAVGIFSNVAPYDLIPGEICFQVENSNKDWYDILEKAITLPEEKRREILDLARRHVISNYSSEVQVQKFISSLEAVELHAKLSNKKIAYFFHESYLGGATLHLLKHALFAKQLGFEIILCLPDYQKDIEELPKLAQQHGLELHYLRYERYVEGKEVSTANLKNFESISDWIVENAVGLIHSVTFMPGVGLAAKFYGIPHVSTLHQFYESNVSQNHFKENKLVDIIHSSSNRYARKWNEKLQVPSRRIVCPPGKEYFDFYIKNSARKQKHGEKVRVLVSGTLQERKNQQCAIKAIHILRNRGYNIYLDLIGYNELRSEYAELCSRTIEELNLSEFVKMWGFTHEPEKFYDENAHVLLCCSTDESMPQTILQAMAAGIMVVSTEVGGVKEIIKDNYTGILADGLDEISLANAIERGIKLNDKEKFELIENAHKTITMIGHPTFVQAELINLYNEAFEQEKINKIPKVLQDQISMGNKKPVSKLDSSLQTNKIINIPIHLKKPTILCGSKLLTKKRIYKFIGLEEGLSGLRLLFGTHEGKCKGRLTIEIMSSKKEDLVLRTIYIDAEKIKDNEYYDIFFDPIDDSRGQEFVIRMHHSADNSYNAGKLSVYEYAVKNTLLHKLMYKLSVRSMYSIHGFSIYTSINR
ncbi:glycosyltransferase [Anaerosolibacter sp.]|uniref:glycosyltransferase n=1 Tax=Anaerosolibacter sp. TaxID=1872527 RepID=UPI0039EF85CD